MDSNSVQNKFSNHSAVIVLHDQSIDSLILTKRTENLRNHPGEICFPGGFAEKVDSSLYHTALRELKEELDVDPERVTLIKEMAIEYTLRGTIIHPWYASIESIIPYRLNDNEVASLIFIPMHLVSAAHNYREIIFEQRGLHIKSCEFIPNEGSIWGATARIMKQFIQR